MIKKKVHYGNATVDYYFQGRFTLLNQIIDKSNAVLITDENVFQNYKGKFKNWNAIVLKAGEEYKVQETADSIIEQLIEMGADRKTFLVGIGGGVITDITGYVAATYMRGIFFGFIPTTLLGLVDASIGGKNGVDVGIYKNLVGTIRQPSFILHDLTFLNTLPENEWRNGFAEVIKHAAIKDAAMFRELENNDLLFYRKKKAVTAALIQRNVLLKTKVVQGDEFEQGGRKLLNFGHTLGHALENQYDLSHGEAISIGMTYASLLSQKIKQFRQPDKLIQLLNQYQLPTLAQFDRDKVINVLRMDKKKEKEFIHFILLEKIGKAVIEPISVNYLYENLS